MFLRLIKKVNTAFSIINNIESIIDNRLKTDRFTKNSVLSKEPLTSETIAGVNEVIVSLTTYGERVKEVSLVIESICEQTLKPNRLILWLDKDEFQRDSLPKTLIKQESRGLEIRFCENLRSYKKLIPTLKLFPHADIITIDDDMLYPIDMIELLISESKLYPQTVICHLAHKINLDKTNKINPYNRWDFMIKDCTPSVLVFPVGAGGVLYPQNILNQECFDDKLFNSLAPYADDVWFKAMSLLNDFKCKKVSDDRPFLKRFHTLNDSQSTGLFKENLLQGRNDYQIEAVFEHFGLTSKCCQNQ